MTPTALAWPPPLTSTPLAVLVSGGLDSAVLLAEAVRAYPRVYPIYVRVGSVWEPLERAFLLRFLEAIATPVLQPLLTLDQPIGDVYGRHWSLTAEAVPDYDSPDEAVFLPGRNVLLLAKPLLWCLLNDIPAIATAPLGSNPFPDATAAFYDGMAAIVAASLGRGAESVQVLRPYADLGLHKVDVVRRGAGLPLQHTFSCLAPVAGHHCGRCNKCAERQKCFAEAGLPDPTHYAA